MIDSGYACLVVPVLSLDIGWGTMAGGRVLEGRPPFEGTTVLGLPRETTSGICNVDFLTFVGRDTLIDDREIYYRVL